MEIISPVGVLTAKGGAGRGTSPARSRPAKRKQRVNSMNLDLARRGMSRTIILDRGSREVQPPFAPCQDQSRATFSRSGQNKKEARLRHALHTCKNRSALRPGEAAIVAGAGRLLVLTAGHGQMLPFRATNLAVILKIAAGVTFARPLDRVAQHVPVCFFIFPKHVAAPLHFGARLRASSSPRNCRSRI